MMYVIKKDNLYFNSGSSGWVNSSGVCDTPAWGSIGNAWGTTLESEAEKIAQRYGGKVVVYC